MGVPGAAAHVVKFERLQIKRKDLCDGVFAFPKKKDAAPAQQDEYFVGFIVALKFRETFGGQSRLKVQERDAPLI